MTQFAPHLDAPHSRVAPRVALGSWLRLLRPHQWIKNVLLFVPLAAAHGLHDAHHLVTGLMAFAAFSLAASSIYVFNDLLDADEDRRHPQTALRPIAHGDIGTLTAILTLGALLLAAALIAVLLPWAFCWMLAAYYITMSLYSLALKRVVVLDILILSAGYSLRVAAGAAALRIAVSPWLIALGGSMFLSLALLKRYVALVAFSVAMGDGSSQDRDSGHGPYHGADAPVLAAQGIASGYVAVLVLALYASSETARRLYRHAWAIWALCVLLVYWLNYIWLMARRGVVPHDPVAFALRDPVSALLIAGMAAAAVLAV